MADLPRLLLGSLMLRPYVYGFLLIHLVGAGALLGWPRTAALTLITWAVAFAAEASSIRTGFPFGWYHYVPQTADRELWIAGVPFFDSLSFPFLLTASYGLAWLLLGKPIGADRGGRARPPRWPHAILAAALFVLLDVVIDPVALRGDRWFLGQIYGYPEPGPYFGIPLANFAGWGVVGLTATLLYQAWEGRGVETQPVRFAARAWLCPGLYFAVLAFNLAVTFAIGEWILGLVGSLLTLPILAWTAITLWHPGTAADRAREEGVYIS